MGFLAAGLATITAPIVIPAIIAGKAIASAGGGTGAAGGVGSALTGAFSPGGMSLEGGGVAEKLARAGRAAALYKATKGEKRFDALTEEGAKELEQERKRLARAKGGFTSDQFSRLVAQGAGQVRSAVGERAAQLARGGSIGVGQSGVQEAAKGQLQKQLGQAIRGIVSDVRDADVAELVRQRLEFSKQKAEQQQRELMSAQLQRQRKTQAVAATMPAQKKTTDVKDRSKGFGLDDAAKAKKALGAIAGGTP